MQRSHGVLLAIAMTAACGDRYGDLEEDGPPRAPPETSTPASSSSSSSSSGSAPSEELPPAVAVQRGISAQEYFTTHVQPALAPCAGCHSNGPGAAWVGDTADASYTLLFSGGYVARDSALLTKGIHFRGAAPAFDAPSRRIVETWIELEMAEEGDTLISK